MSHFLLFYYQSNNNYNKAATDFICVVDNSFPPFFVFLSCAVADTSYWPRRTKANLFGVGRSIVCGNASEACEIILLRFCYSFLFALQLQSWEIKGLLAPRLFLLVVAIAIWDQRAHLEIICSNCHVYLTISINKQRTSRVISRYIVFFCSCGSSIPDSRFRIYQFFLMNEIDSFAQLL